MARTKGKGKKKMVAGEEAADAEDENKLLEISKRFKEREDQLMDKNLMTKIEEDMNFIRYLEDKAEKEIEMEMAKWDAAFGSCLKKNEYYYRDSPTSETIAGPEETEDRSVFVRNLDNESELMNVKRHFDHCGTITSIITTMGYATVVFNEKVAVENALKLDGSKLGETCVKVISKETDLPGWRKTAGFRNGIDDA